MGNKCYCCWLVLLFSFIYFASSSSIFISRRFVVLAITIIIIFLFIHFYLLDRHYMVNIYFKYLIICLIPAVAVYTIFMFFCTFFPIQFSNCVFCVVHSFHLIFAFSIFKMGSKWKECIITSEIYRKREKTCSCTQQIFSYKLNVLQKRTREW